MLATTRGVTIYIPGNINKRAIITTVAEINRQITEGRNKRFFLYSPCGNFLALGTINNW